MFVCCSVSVRALNKTPMMMPRNVGDE